MKTDKVLEFPDVDTILLDIEGTICPVTFVKDVLFPYALSSLPSLLHSHFSTDPSSRSSDLTSILSSPSIQPPSTSSNSDPIPPILTKINHLTASNSKDPAFKSLQHLAFKRGFEIGHLTIPLYADVAPKIRHWVQRQGLQVAIYSSGAVAAQRLLLRYVGPPPPASPDSAPPLEDAQTTDLTPLIAAYFDPAAVGPKSEAQSYVNIARQMRSPATGPFPLPESEDYYRETQKEGREEGQRKRILFLSDSLSEVRAARDAGLRAVLVRRAGESDDQQETEDQSQDEGDVSIAEFGQVEVERECRVAGK